MIYNIFSYSRNDENEKDKSPENPNEDNLTEEELGPKFLDIYSSIYSMRQELDRIRKPIGSRENPVRTCRDLFYGHPHFNDGWCSFDRYAYKFVILQTTRKFTNVTKTQAGIGSIQTWEWLTMLCTFIVT